MEVKVNNRLRKYKKMLNLELFEKYGIGGIYTEYMQRSFCKCGYVTNERLHVCPNCGQQNFIEPTNYKIILEQSEKNISLVGNEIQQSVNTLEYAYTKDEAVLELVESKKVLFSFTENTHSSRSYYGGYYQNYDDETSVEIRDLIRKNKLKFSSEYLAALDLAEELGAERPELKATNWKNFMKPGQIQAAAHIKTYKDTNKALLFALLDDAVHNGLDDCKSVKQYIKDNNIPSILENHLNAKVLKDFQGHSGYYSRSTANDYEVIYAKMPEIMKNIMVHYYLNGLITVDQLKLAPAVSLELWEINPDLALTQLKKYFVNFTGNTRGYYGYWNRNNKPKTMDEVVEYYQEKGFPIEDSNFDLRNYNAMKNNDVFKQAGWDELTISVETANMETSPVQALINIASTRRKRKKED